MLSGAGATIHSMPSSRIYKEMEAGGLQVANTSSASFVSFRLYEQVKCFTPAGEDALWFMYHPVLMNKSTFEALTPEQQTALLRAAERAEAFFAEEAAKQDDLARQVFVERGVEIVEMDEIDHAEWFGVAKETSYEAFLADMPDGFRLLQMALSIR